MATPDTVHDEIFDALRRRDFDGIRALYHPEFSYVGGDGSCYDGPDAGVAVAKMYTGAFPDLRTEVVSRFAKGDTAVIEYRVTGTHQGALAGIEPTGKKMDLIACNVMVVRDGLCYQEREYFDALAMMVQLGVLESPMHG